MDENKTRKAVYKQARQNPEKGQLAKEVFMLAQVMKHIIKHVERETNLLTKLESCNVNDRDTYGIDLSCQDLRTIADDLMKAVDDSLDEQKPF